MLVVASVALVACGGRDASTPVVSTPECSLAENLARRAALLAAQPALAVAPGSSKTVRTFTKTFPSVAGSGSVLCEVPLAFRDLDGDGALTPYEDWTLPAETRAADLAARLGPAGRRALLLHPVLSDQPSTGATGLAAATAALVDAGVRAGQTVAATSSPRARAAWSNALQARCEAAALGVPFLLSSPPVGASGPDGALLAFVRPGPCLALDGTRTLEPHPPAMSVLLAALSALLYGAADFSGGLAARRAPVLPVLVISQGAGAAAAVVFVLAGGYPLPALPDVAWGLCAGASGAVGLALLYRGIARALVALVSPTAALVGAAIPVAFGVVSGERPSSTAVAGAALCLPAILLLSWERGGAVARDTVRSSLAYGLSAGVFIGGFFIALAHTSPGSGLWPVLAARAASVPLALAAALVARQRLSVPRASLAAALAAGLADMGANVLFLLAARAGLLSISVMVTSLYPAPTVLLAWIFFRERVSPVRAFGMALAIAGVALIGLR